MPFNTEETILKTVWKLKYFHPLVVLNILTFNGLIFKIKNLSPLNIVIRPSTHSQTISKYMIQRHMCALPNIWITSDWQFVSPLTSDCSLWEKLTYIILYIQNKTRNVSSTLSRPWTFTNSICWSYHQRGCLPWKPTAYIFFKAHCPTQMECILS